jgi:Kelch motif
MVWFVNKYFRNVFLSALLSALASQVPAFGQVITTPPMPFPRFGMCSARVENTIYLIGGAQSLQGRNLENVRGTSTVQAFNFETMTWDTNIAPLETPRVFACAVALDDSIYVMGGVDSLGNVLNTVEVYDPSANAWHYTTPMKLSRKGAAAVAFDDYIIVFGGGGPMGSPFREVEAYSVENGTWKVTYSMVLARVYHKVVRINDSIYIFGGNSGQIGLVNIIERYVPTIGPVQVAVTLGAPRMLFGTVERKDSVFVISGLGSTGNEFRD